jgi:hypothetical protein
VNLAVVRREPLSYLPALSDGFRSSVTMLFLDAIRYRQLCVAEARGDATEIKRIRDWLKRAPVYPALAEPVESADQISMYRYLARKLGITLPQ